MEFKKTVSFITALSIITAGIAVPVFAQTAVPEDYLFNLTFDESQTGSGSYAASSGGVVTENGNVSYADGKEGKALRIAEKSASNYLSLPEGILSGKEAATYSFWLKPESDGVPNWAFMTTSLEQQVFTNEKYVGMLSTTSSYTVERYNNSGTRLSTVSVSGDYSDWKYVTVVAENSVTNVYINGILAASDNKEVDLSGVFTSDSKTWIGHANWGSGEGFCGMIDEFRIYGRALSEEEIIALAGDAYTQEIRNELKEYNRLNIKTDFYKSGNKVFQYSVNDTITAQVNIENLKLKNTDAEVSLEAYGSDGTEIDGTKITQTYSLGVKKKAEFKKAIAVLSDAAYYKITVTENKGTEEERIYDGGRICKSSVSFPDTSPEDSALTTEGAHDPTIFKDPVSKKYYAYSSHNLVYESEDLINWTEHDYTASVTVPPKAKAFIDANYTNTQANTTYWAPDLYYKEGDEYPYWFYLSTSCGLGGRNSVISLVKAKSPGLWDGETVDCGVVIASKETADYNTNCIDANIFTDTDGKTYFIWGSFWKGIHMAELDTETGLVKGIDYTSDATILSSGKKFGTRVYSTPAGVVGPEGPYTIYNEETGYRYMFTSYGWLGTNYNIRVARTNKSFSEILSAKDPHKQLLDQKNRPVGATYADQVKEGGSLSELWGYKMSGSFQLDDGIEYLGSGHNSVFKDDDGQWYLVQHCRKVADAVAFLQVKKILWTSDGWPVISPLVYAGEKEQTIPKDMIYGTWDLSSVGHTVFADGVTDVSKSGAYKGSDLPVHSSQIILQPDGKIGNNIGTWEYDNDHTVTLNFETDGIESGNQYFKAGDTMELFVLTGYDKDKRESALVMTGTDQNSTASFAKKNNAFAQSTANTKTIETTPIVIEKDSASNPMLGFDAEGNTVYAGDPAALADGDTVYLYAGHDTSTSDGYTMPEWICYSSKDMSSWKYEGVVMSATDVSWRNDDTSAWASQAIKYGGKYYLYFCTWDKTSQGKQSIGVAVSNSPTGPFTDIGTPIVKGTLTEPQTSNWNDIDPTVWVETIDGEEHRYLAWGNGIFYVCELNEDMISVKDLNGDGQIKMNDDIKQQEFTNLREGLGFTEAPWIYRRQDENGNYYGKYYLFAAFGWREQMGYATSDSMWGPWEFQEVLMPPTATSNTNHPSVIDFKGNTYFIYHNGSMPWGSGYRRVVCAEKFNFRTDGLIDPIQETSTGISGTKSSIRLNEGYVYYDDFTNPADDGSYPLKKGVRVGIGINSVKNTQWEINAGKADRNNENYVSIQAVNKPGLYITGLGDNSVMLTQDANCDDVSMQKAMTFKTIKGINGANNSVSFESVLKPGYYLTVWNGKLTLESGTTLESESASFQIGEALSTASAKIDNPWIKDGKSVMFTLKNADIYQNVSAYAAEYSNEGILMGVGVYNDIKITSAEQTIEIPYERKSESTVIKVLVWRDTLPAAAAAWVTETVNPNKTAQ